MGKDGSDPHKASESKQGRAVGRATGSLEAQSAGTRKRRKVLLSRRLNLAALSVLTVNASKRRYEMRALPEARPLLSLLAQRAAPSRPLSTWLTPAFKPHPLFQ